MWIPPQTCGITRPSVEAGKNFRSSNVLRPQRLQRHRYFDLHVGAAVDAADGPFPEQGFNDMRSAQDRPGCEYRPRSGPIPRIRRRARERDQLLRAASVGACTFAKTEPFQTYRPRALHA